MNMTNKAPDAMSLKFLTISLVISVIHHIDHILRIDHSGWPFIVAWSPFTYSLLVYPVFASIYLIRNNLYRIIATSVLLLTATVAHIFFEPLRDKFHTWAYKSDLPGHVNEDNLLGINSPVLGVISIAIAVVLSLMLLLTLLSFFRNTKR